MPSLHCGSVVIAAGKNIPSFWNNDTTPRPTARIAAIVIRPAAIRTAMLV
jgi:hypothetical protein